MLTVTIEEAAARVEACLAARAFTKVEEICLECNLDWRTDWPKVKAYMVKRGYPIAYIPGKGHFLGGPGVEVLNFHYKLRTVVAYERRGPELRRLMREVQAAGGPAWRYLQDTYGVSDPGELEAEDLKRIKKQDLPDMGVSDEV